MGCSGGSAESADRPCAEVTVTPYRDGPLIIRGPFRLLDQDGGEYDPGRAVVALCRCGRSRQKPFCDGTHALAQFRAGSAPEDPER